jgi:hypothetical protein
VGQLGFSGPLQRVSGRACEPLELTGSLGVIHLPLVAFERRIGDACLRLKPGDLHVRLQRYRHEGVLRRVDPPDADAKRPQAAVPGRRAPTPAPPWASPAPCTRGISSGRCRCRRGPRSRHSRPPMRPWCRSQSWRRLTCRMSSCPRCTPRRPPRGRARGGRRSSRSSPSGRGGAGSRRGRDRSA